MGYFLRFRLGNFCRFACYQHTEGSYRASQLRTADEEIISERLRSLHYLRGSTDTKPALCLLGFVKLVLSRLGGCILQRAVSDAGFLHPWRPRLDSLLAPARKKKTLKDQTSGAIISSDSGFQGCGFGGVFLVCFTFFARHEDFDKISRKAGKGC